MKGVLEKAVAEQKTRNAVRARLRPPASSAVRRLLAGGLFSTAVAGAVRRSGGRGAECGELVAAGPPVGAARRPRRPPCAPASEFLAGSPRSLVVSGRAGALAAGSRENSMFYSYISRAYLCRPCVPDAAPFGCGRTRCQPHVLQPQERRRKVQRGRRTSEGLQLRLAVPPRAALFGRRRLLTG